MYRVTVVKIMISFAVIALFIFVSGVSEHYRIVRLYGIYNLRDGKSKFRCFYECYSNKHVVGPINVESFDKKSITGCRGCYFTELNGFERNKYKTSEDGKIVYVKQIQDRLDRPALDYTLPNKETVIFASNAEKCFVQHFVEKWKWIGYEEFQYHWSQFKFGSGVDHKIPNATVRGEVYTPDGFIVALNTCLEIKSDFTLFLALMFLKRLLKCSYVKYEFILGLFVRKSVILALEMHNIADSEEIFDFRKVSEINGSGKHHVDFSNELTEVFQEYEINCDKFIDFKMLREAFFQKIGRSGELVLTPFKVVHSAGKDYAHIYCNYRYYVTILLDINNAEYGSVL